MSNFSDIFQYLVVKRLNQAYQFSTEFAPKLLLALIILFIGWLCAVLLKKIISKFLKALGFVVLSQKIGLKNFLENGGVKQNPSFIIGLGFYWLIILSALIMAFNTLELEAAARLIRQVVWYIPKIIVTLIILVLGIFLSKFVSRFVQTTSRLANIPFFSVLGIIARYAVIAIAIILGLEYLDVATSIIFESFLIVFIVVPLICALVLIVGGRQVVASILAGRLLKKEFKEGETINFDTASGQIKAINLIVTKIRSGGEEIIIPNSELITKTIKRVKGDARPQQL